jgi:endonuclease/exonuclease/phosphatase family metal-dependent hydrolase
MMKWPKILFILLAVFIILPLVLLTAATLADYRPDEKETAEVQGKARDIQVSDSIFTITTWNLGYFGLGKECDFFYDGGRMTRPGKSDYLNYSDQAISYLGSADKNDFYFFQEVDVNSRRSYHDDQVTRLREIFPGREYSFALNYNVFFVPMPLCNPMGKVQSGLLSFSAFHSMENTRYSFPGGYKWPIRLFQLDRCFLLTRLKLPDGRELVLINTHNEAFDDGSQRNQQMAVLKDMMLQEYGKGNCVITGGDWNQNPVGFNHAHSGAGETGEFPRAFLTGDRARTIDPAIDPGFFPAGWQWIFDPATPSNRDVDQSYKKGETPTTIIDFFVVSPNITVLDIGTKNTGFEWSDHQPVRMTFKIKL